MAGTSANSAGCVPVFLNHEFLLTSTFVSGPQERGPGNISLPGLKACASDGDVIVLNDKAFGMSGSEGKRFDVTRRDFAGVPGIMRRQSTRMNAAQASHAKPAIAWRRRGSQRSRSHRSPRICGSNEHRYCSSVDPGVAEPATTGIRSNQMPARSLRNREATSRN
jgi:hypothetical protein